MKQITADLTSPQLILLFFSSFSVLLTAGLADGSSASNDSKNESSKKSSGGSNVLNAFLICLALVVVGAFSVYLYKLWQKKKREEQHARLLKLFEQDDELEVELGIRD